jgi:hypothetical protein
VGEGATGKVYVGLNINTGTQTIKINKNKKGKVYVGLNINTGAQK